MEWLTAKGKARNRAEALMLATGLINEGFLQPASDLSKEAVENTEQTAFLDDTNALYYFVMSNENLIIAYLSARLLTHGANQVWCVCVLCFEAGGQRILLRGLLQ